MTKKHKVTLSIVIAVLVLVAGAGAAYVELYKNRVIPRTTVAGINARGMDISSLGTALSNKVENTKVDVTIGDFHQTVSLADLGISVDVGATAEKALASSQTAWSRLVGLLKSRHIPAIVSIDNKKQSEFLTASLQDAGKLITEPTISWSKADQKFVVTPGAEGYDVDHQVFSEEVAKLAHQLRSGAVKMDPKISGPHLSQEQAQAAANSGDQIVALEVAVSDAESVLPASAEEKASWIDFPTNDSGFKDPQVNPERVKKWLEKTAESTNVPAQPQVNNVDASGKVLARSRPGTSGWKVNNVAQLSKELVAALQAGQSYSGKFSYAEVAPETTTQPVAPGAEKLAYPAAAGEKWIDVNLSNNTMTAYEGATAVHGPVLIVPGKPAMPTVEGTYNIYLKLEKQTMKGKNYDGRPYEVKDVPWIMYFFEDYAIHGAPWFSQFGWSGPHGTHGCVNAPVPEAKWLYDWTELGTIVVTHH